MSKKKGFTIIEFMLAMALLSTMLLMIAMLTVQMTNIYQKGLSLRAVNTLGRTIADDFTRTIQSSPIQRDVNPPAPSGGLANISNDAILEKRKDYFVTKQSTANTSLQGSGLFCTGNFTYVWNTRYTFIGESGASVISDDAITINGTAHKFARVPDMGRKLCEELKNNPSSFKNIEVDNPDNIIDLIGNDETDIMLYDLTVLPAYQSNITGHAMYPISYILATRRGGVSITSNGDFCTGKPKPDDADSASNEFNAMDLDYCAVNKFDIVVRQSGESEDINGYGS